MLNMMLLNVPKVGGTGITPCLCDLKKVDLVRGARHMPETKQGHRAQHGHRGCATICARATTGRVEGETEARRAFEAVWALCW